MGNNRLISSPEIKTINPEIAAVILATIFALAPLDTRAQDWRFEPVITLFASFNDNIRLAEISQDEDEISGGELDAQAHITRASPTGSVAFIPRVVASNYPDDPEDEYTDVYFDFVSRHRAQKSDWSFMARYSDVEVLTAEISDPDFDNPDIDRPITDDTGLVQSANTRERFFLSPAVEFQLTDNTSLEVTADYVDVGYENSMGDLTDYSDANIEANLSYQASERDTFGLTILGSQYDTDDDSFSSEGYGAYLSVTREITQRTSGYILAGYKNTDSEDSSSATLEKSSDGSTLFGLGVTRENEISRLVVELSSSVDPTGEGNVVERNQLRGAFTRQISPVVTATANFRYQETDSLDTINTQDDRDFVQMTLGLNWQFKRAWFLTSSYTYTQQEFSDRPQDASSNWLRIGLRYAPPRRY